MTPAIDPAKVEALCKQASPGAMLTPHDDKGVYLFFRDPMNAAAMWKIASYHGPLEFQQLLAAFDLSVRTNWPLHAAELVEARRRIEEAEAEIRALKEKPC